MTKKQKSKLGITFIESDNASMALAFNCAKAQGALEMLEYLTSPWTPEEEACCDSDHAFYARIDTQRKLLKKFLSPPKIKRSK